MSTQTLSPRLDEAKAAIAQAAPADLVTVLTDEQSRLVSTTDPSSLVKAGDTLPAFTLPDPTGKQVSLEQLVADGPAVIVFYRGAWCPYCNVALAAYQQEVLPELQRLGVPLAAISPQGPDGSLTIAEKNALTFPVLTDESSSLARGLGLVFALTDDVKHAHDVFGNDFATIHAGGEYELPMPTVLVVGSDRVVTYADVHPDYTTRTEPADVLAAVHAALPGTAGA